LSCTSLHLAETARELHVRFVERARGVDDCLTRKIHDSEQQIAELLFQAAVRLVVARRRASLCELGMLRELVAHLQQLLLYLLCRPLHIQTIDTNTCRHTLDTTGA